MTTPSFPLLRAVFGLSVFLLTSGASAQPSVSGSAGLVSQYHWRGYTLADGPAFQAGVDVEAGGLSLSLWGSAATADRATLGAADEFDLTLTYGSTFGRLGWSTGLTYYTFPNQARFAWSDHATPEVFVQLAPQIVLHPTVGLYYDLHLGDGLYAEFSVGHEIGVGLLPLGIHSAVGYNHDQFGADPGVTHADIAVSTDLPIGSFAVSPAVTLVRSFANTGRPETHVLFGLHVSR